MIRHLHPQGQGHPGRVVLLGGSGFLGRHLIAHLRTLGIETLGLSSTDLPLDVDGAGSKLAGILRADDALVFASCLTPDKGKDIRTAMRNLAMGEQVCAALKPKACAHVIYLSSDGVYADDESLVRETSRCEPSSLYGLGHLTRERMIRITAEAAGIPWLIARATLIYGGDDSHNSYGPNRFARQVRDSGTVKLFGNGEEKRDHVHVDDAASLLALCLRHQSTGILNVATGVSTSFLDVAQLCIAAIGKPAAIDRLPRSGPITHRHYDLSTLARAFPTFRFRSLKAGVAQAYSSTAAAAA